MEIKDYVVVTVMAATWIVLQIVKPLFNDNKNIKKFIPLFAAVLGVVFTLWINGKIDFMYFLQGIASGFSATGLNEGINAIFFSEDEDAGKENKETEESGEE